jgi:hypothetical protein
VHGFLRLPLLLVATTVFAASPDEAGVKGVVQQFQQALERRDIAAIEALVSPDVVVLENGHRNEAERKDSGTRGKTDRRTSSKRI